MKKILIMLGSYFPRPSANGICVHEVALALKKMGYEVHIICFRKQTEGREYVYDDIYVHTVEPTLLCKMAFYGVNNSCNILGKFATFMSISFNRIKKVFYFPFYPLGSVFLCYRYYSTAKKLHKHLGFDLLLSVYTPIENCISSTIFKKKFPDILLGLYDLDALTNGNSSKFLPKIWADKSRWNWARYMYRNYDFLLNLKCHENHYKHKRYDVFREKMIFVDVPLFTGTLRMSSKNTNYFEGSCFNWVYAGSLSKYYRNPEYLCTVFSRIKNRHKTKLHFYSHGDCEEIIEKYKNEYGDIISHGYVPRTEIMIALSNAEILVSIGNKNSEMIPSKIFEYMFFRKKIIHFYFNKNDPCIEYYKKYQNALLIDMKESIEDSFDKINSFILSPKKEVSPQNLHDIFVENTPEYTAQLISNLMKDEEV